MAKYHLNAKGEPGVCKATKGSCPFGGDEKHYPSKEVARNAFELSQKTLPTPEELYESDNLPIKRSGNFPVGRGEYSHPELRARRMRNVNEFELKSLLEKKTELTAEEGQRVRIASEKKSMWFLIEVTAGQREISLSQSADETLHLLNHLYDEKAHNRTYKSYIPGDTPEFIQSVALSEILKELGAK